MGAAQTGSGKTLAYGLPLLQHIVTSKSNPKKVFSFVLLKKYVIFLFFSAKRPDCFDFVSDSRVGSARFKDSFFVCLFIFSFSDGSFEKRRKVLF